MSDDIITRAVGRWFDILTLNGLPAHHLTGKHGPCPMCGGKDRFNFSNKDGFGGWFCNQCGSGWGVHLLMRFCGFKDYHSAFNAIDKVIGSTKYRPAKPTMSEDKMREAALSAWSSGVAPDAAILAEAEDHSVLTYLARRHIFWNNISDIRQSSRGNMIALVRDPTGDPCQLQCTLLTRDGQKRNENGKTRLFLPGKIAIGAAVRLMSYGDTLGVAEGVETALSAKLLFGTPCWAVLNTALMCRWMPPIEVKHVIVFGDNDANHAGQIAAHTLAGHLVKYGIGVDVIFPENEGTDWNDELRMRVTPEKIIFEKPEPQSIDASREGLQHEHVS